MKKINTYQELTSHKTESSTQENGHQGPEEGYPIKRHQVQPEHARTAIRINMMYKLSKEER